MHIILLENQYADCKLRYAPYRAVSIRDKTEPLWIWIPNTENSHFTYSINSLNQSHIKELSGVKRSKIFSNEIQSLSHTTNGTVLRSLSMKSSEILSELTHRAVFRDKIN